MRVAPAHARVRRLALAVATLVAALVAAVPPTAFGFVVDGEPASSPPRWSSVRASLVDSGDRGLGGGLEYAVAESFCDRVAPQFVDEPRPSCRALRTAVARAFDRWAIGHPTLRFEDVSSRVAAALPPPGVADPWRGFGAEIDLFAFRPEEYPDVAGFGAWTTFWWSDRRPIGPIGSLLEGSSITSADIVLSTGVCYYQDPALAASGCNHFESLVLHEIGHALGLGHPNQAVDRDYALVPSPAGLLTADCSDPMRTLRRSAGVDPAAVMNSSLRRPEPLHVGLTTDDLAGRNFLYPVCSG